MRRTHFGSTSPRLGAISASMLSKERSESNLVSGNEGGIAGICTGASIVPVVIRDMRDRLVAASSAHMGK